MLLMILGKMIQDCEKSSLVGKNLHNTKYNVSNEKLTKCRNSEAYHPSGVQIQEPQEVDLNFTFPQQESRSILAEIKNYIMYLNPILN